MEIKRVQSSAIQQNVTEQNSSLTPSASAGIQKGIASAKDGFEVVQQNPIQPTPNSNSVQLPAVQKQISAYMSGQDNSGNLFPMMMDYQRMMGKEAREDRQLSQTAKQSELASQSAKLVQDNEAIDQGMNEASLEFFIGQAGRLVKGDVQKDIDAMSNRLNELKNSADQIKAKLTSEATSEEQQITIDARYRSISNFLVD